MGVPNCLRASLEAKALAALSSVFPKIEGQYVRSFEDFLRNYDGPIEIAKESFYVSCGLNHLGIERAQLQTIFDRSLHEWQEGADSGLEAKLFESLKEETQDCDNRGLSAIEIRSKAARAVGVYHPDVILNDELPGFQLRQVEDAERDRLAAEIAGEPESIDGLLRESGYGEAFSDYPSFRRDILVRAIRTKAVKEELAKKSVWLLPKACDIIDIVRELKFPADAAAVKPMKEALAGALQDNITQRSLVLTAVKGNDLSSKIAKLLDMTGALSLVIG